MRCNILSSYHTLIGRQCHSYHPSTFGNQSVELRKIDALEQMVACRDEFFSIKKVDSHNDENRSNFLQFYKNGKKLSKTWVVNMISPEFLVSIYCCMGSNRSNQL